MLRFGPGVTLTQCRTAVIKSLRLQTEVGLLAQTLTETGELEGKQGAQNDFDTALVVGLWVSRG